jgi:alkaline phosphatase
MKSTKLIKLISIVTAFMLTIFLLTGCNEKNPIETTSTADVIESMTSTKETEETSEVNGNLNDLMPFITENFGLTTEQGQELSLTDNSLPYSINKDIEKISLADFIKKGIEVLDNKNGFFMMVEGGKIDWACHANDAATCIAETIAFDDAVKEAIKFYNSHKEETLIVVTGDHETGGMSLGFAGTGYSNSYSVLDAQKVSYEALQNKVLEYKKSQQ